MTEKMVPTSTQLNNAAMNLLQVEVRLTTYRRPKLLMRALNSLRDQTNRNWRAIVFDDSPDGEGQAVVEEFADSRVVYRRNPANLGMILNLGQAFAKRPYFQDSTHACILEDDNAFDPLWLEQNLSALARSNCRVMVRNYRVIDILENGELQTNPSQPMRELYGHSPREISFEERVREAFFSFTLGTCCYFWDLHSEIDLRFPEEQIHGPVMEAGRAICFHEACWYEPEPFSTFSRFVCKTMTPRREGSSSTRLRRMAKANEVRFTRRLISIWTLEFARTISEIIKVAKQRPDGDEALQRLAEAGCLRALLRLRKPQQWIKVLKTTGVRFAYGRA